MPHTCYFIKKETLSQVLFCEFCEMLKNTFFIEHLRWLLEPVWDLPIIYDGTLVQKQLLAERLYCVTLQYSEITHVISQKMV